MASNSGVICLVVAWLLGSVLEVMASILPEWGVCYQRIEWHIMFRIAIFFPKVRIKLSFFYSRFLRIERFRNFEKKFFSYIKHLQHPTSVMRKNPCGSRSGTQINDRIMIRSPRLWSGAKCLWSGTKINGFRMTEVGHMKICLIKVSKSFKSQKSVVKKFTFLYWDLEKDSRFPQSIICGFTYHWPLQSAVVHMTITLCNYYFFHYPGLNRGNCV